MLASLRQLILPAHCAACGAPAPAEGRMPLCERCGKELARVIECGHCPRCGRNAGPYTSGPEGCLFCRHYPIRHDATVRLGPYEFPLKTLILRVKYEGRVEVAPVLGRLLAERVALASWADRVDLVVPVPLHWGRRFDRGFNQSEILARAVASVVPGRLARRLTRIRPTPHQARLSAKERQRNVRGAFRVRWWPRDVAGRRVLLVDDVMTSGTTIAECTKVLRKAGAAEVYAALVATADYDEPGVW